MPEQTYTIEDLRKKLDEFEAELRAAGLRESSVETYTKGPRSFLRWLTGDYTPRGPVK